MRISEKEIEIIVSIFDDLKRRSHTKSLIRISDHMSRKYVTEVENEQFSGINYITFVKFCALSVSQLASIMLNFFLSTSLNNRFCFYRAFGAIKFLNSY